jgi:hypothetical protein
MIVLIHLMGCFRKVDQRLMSCLGLLMGRECCRGGEWWMIVCRGQGVGFGYVLRTGRG